MEYHSRHDSAMPKELVAEEAKAPPIPEKSQLRSLPKTERLRPIQENAEDKTAPNVEDHDTAPKSANRKGIRKTVTIHTDESKHDKLEISTSVDHSKALEILRFRLSTLRTTMSLFKDGQSKRSSKTPEELDFLEGKMTLYSSIIQARRKRFPQKSSDMRVDWLHFNDDLDADARVTAHGEDIRDSSSFGSAFRKVGSPATRFELIEATEHVKLIGPAYHGALTVAEMWRGGEDKLHKFDSHQNTLPVLHDESCLCKLYQVWQAITDESYKYMGVARSFKTRRWIVHLAKKMPTNADETTRTKEPPTTSISGSSGNR